MSAVLAPSPFFLVLVYGRGHPVNLFVPDISRFLGAKDFPAVFAIITRMVRDAEFSYPSRKPIATVPDNRMA